MGSKATANGKAQPGSRLDDVLRADGSFARAHALAMKRVLAFQVERLMTEQNVSKAELARRMKTSRAQLDRLLDPENTSITLQTMDKAAAALGKTLKVEGIGVA